ncbi:Uncharacterized protein Rs2_17763 [Raphanus sativus]|nr:Uncharacterized protein Rs2_17763 [Raphanus sativus]
MEMSHIFGSTCSSFISPHHSCCSDILRTSCIQEESCMSITLKVKSFNDIVSSSSVTVEVTPRLTVKSSQFRCEFTGSVRLPTVAAAHRLTVVALTPLSSREKAGSSKHEVGLNRSVSLSVAVNPPSSVESPQAYASRVLKLHHYGLLRRIPPIYSSILQYLVSYTFMEPEMKRVSTATTSLAPFVASFTTRLITGSTVQECGLASFACYYVNVAFPTHYAVSSIDGSSRCDPLTFFLVARTIVQECRRARFVCYYVTAALLSHYAVSSIDGSSQSQLCDLQTGVGTRRPNLLKAFYLLSDVCSHTFRLNEYDDCMISSLLGITCWAQHGNVEFRGLDPIKPSSPSSIFILSTSLEVKLELEIHLVSSVSCVGFKAKCSCFSAKSSQIGLRTFSVVYVSRASHLKLWPVNNTRCINVVFDYQLFLGTIAMGSKVELPFGFLHFAEHDSPLDGFIFSCFVMSFSFVRPSSMAPESFTSVVTDDAP